MAKHGVFDVHRCLKARVREVDEVKCLFWRANWPI